MIRLVIIYLATLAIGVRANSLNQFRKLVNNIPPLPSSGSASGGARSFGGHCQDWLLFDECVFYKKYCYDPSVELYCPKTCGVCSGGSEEPAYCSGWADKDSCVWFYLDCPITCKPYVCSKACGVGVKYTSTTVKDKEKREYEECNDFSCSQSTPCSSGYSPKRWDRDLGCCKNPPSGNICGRTSLAGITANSRIIGGVASLKKEFPWHIALTHGDIYACGGAIVGHKWVITASHCVSGFPASNMKVLTGIIEINPTTITNAVRNVAKVIINPDWDANKDVVNGDVALLKLKDPLTFNDNVRSICFPGPEPFPEDSTCIIHGFGSYSKEDLTTFSEKLQKAQVEMFSNDVCLHGYTTESTVALIEKYSDKLICAGRLNGEVDSCFGDSGGALICQRDTSCQWVLAGIVSFGPENNCAVKKSPGMYAKISHYQSWITNTIANN